MFLFLKPLPAEIRKCTFFAFWLTPNKKILHYHLSFSLSLSLFWTDFGADFLWRIISTNSWVLSFFRSFSFPHFSCLNFSLCNTKNFSKYDRNVRIVQSSSIEKFTWSFFQISSLYFPSDTTQSQAQRHTLCDCDCHCHSHITVYQNIALVQNSR
jgi:hypothetical protein